MALKGRPDALALSTIPVSPFHGGQSTENTTGGSDLTRGSGITSSHTKSIPIPSVDIWTFLFERTNKPFPDDQPIYTCPSTNRRYTYKDVRTTALQFGSGLRSRLDWKQGDVLAIFSPNCIDTPAVTWGCHWAGGIVSPSASTYSVEELTHHLQDCDAKALVTQLSLLPVAIQAATAANLPTMNIFLIGDDRNKGSPVKSFTELLDASGSVERAKVSPDDLAYLVYSSGTTGLPKGVMLTHENIVANQTMCRSVEGKMFRWETDKILSVLPFYHIYGVACLMHQPMLIGVETVVMSQFDLKSFCSIIQHHRITYSYIVPPIILNLAKSPIVDTYDLSSLRMLTSGAAPLSKDLILAVYGRLAIPVKQAYGLSETSPMTHCQTWDTWKSAIGSVGPPLPNLRLKFVAPDDTEVAPGQSGELWIKGPSIFKGYYKNNEATAAAITSDGYFKTGDIGFEDADGNLYITDRVKELIKYKGSQVAPAELEGILATHPMVNDAAVIGIYIDAIASEVPLAFIVPADHVPRTEESAKEIIAWLGKRTANAKRLRGGIIWIDEILKSSSGKIIRRAMKSLAVGPDALMPMGAVNYSTRSML